MVFSSTIFIFAYLPAVLLLYYLIPQRYQLYFLFVVNLVFYGWGEPIYVLIMVFSIIINYTSARLLSHFSAMRKLILTICIILNLLVLGYFKYSGFVLENLSLIFSFIKDIDIPVVTMPIGISFYTFQSMSYVIDVYRKDVEVQKNPIVFGTYVSLFPQLIAGPIVRYQDVEKEMLHRQIRLSDVNEGLKIFIVGLSKKLLLANPMGQMWKVISQTPSGSGLAGAWVGLLAYSFQIYFDFSGYSDMAIGLGKMIGFNFLENFNYPYISDSITAFWRRWHISLSTWFRMYVYIPLGGNRKGRTRQMINIMIVWFLTGLWHGASWNFVLWGLYFAVLLLVEKLFLLRLLKKLPRVFRHVYALFFIVIGWALFYFTDLSALSLFVSGLFSWNAQKIFSPESLILTLAHLPTMFFCVAAATPIPKLLWRRVKPDRRIPLEAVAALILFILCAAAVTSQSYNPFIYFRF